MSAGALAGNEADRIDGAPVIVAVLLVSSAAAAWPVVHKNIAIERTTCLRAPGCIRIARVEVEKVGLIEEPVLPSGSDVGLPP